MKERFWFAYYWVMLLYLIGAITIWCYLDFNIDHMEYEKDFFRPKSFVFQLERYLFFNFTDISSQRCDVVRENTDMLIRFQEVCKNLNIEYYRYTYIRNIFPFILVFLMTVIRFVFTGKHIWQRP